jgi:uncharacterized protein YndB with AHSA1/START domain
MHLETRIKAPAEHVWAFLCDTSQWDDWDPRHSHTDFTGQVDEVGTTWIEASRLMGFRMRTTQEVVEVEPQRLLHYHTDSGPAEAYYRLDAEGDMTRFTFDCDFEMPSRTPGFIQDFMVSRANRYPEQALADFKALAEKNLLAQS